MANITQSITWRPISETPTERISALMAYWDADLECTVLLPELYIWQGDRWEGEDSGCRPVIGQWWVPESDLVAGLDRMMEA